MKTVHRLFKILKAELPHYPEMPLSGCALKVNEMGMQRDPTFPCSPQHDQQQLRHGCNPSAHQRTNALTRVWYLYEVAFHHGKGGLFSCHL